eukprot:Nitzschia sp. Nitz4//scaffold426_size8320//833//2395//NITZ4_009126-RA/size8320-processed-gene-0.5-mRNA-1//-1//CDS//3329551612//5219//frame0
MASTTAPRPPPPPPPPPSGGAPNTEAVETPSKSNPACQLEAAADLIRSLDAAYTEMSHHAADAAKDAEMARRNSRAASEIARRFMNPRSIATPHSPTSKLLGMQFANKNSNESTAAGDGSVNTHSTPPRIQRTSYSPLSKAITGTGSPAEARQDWNGFLANSTPPHTEKLQSTLSAPATSPSRNATRSRMHQAYSTTERIAQSHAEDVLALSMELERCKQALKSEKRMHADTKAAMAGHKEAAERLEQERIQLVEELEQTKLQASHQRQELEYELSTAKHLLQAAEEDALVALELAKGNSEKQNELESELHAAKEELARLKAAPSHPHSRVPPPPPSPKRVVRFADEQVLPATPAPPVSPPPSASTPSRNMVATGRQLLRRSRITSPQEEVIQLELTPAKAAERRQQLRNKLAQLEQETKLATPAKATSSTTLTSPEKRSPADPSLITTAIGRLIHDSGKRLELHGPHWSRPGASAQDVEAMTRSYCQLVEGRIGTQRKELDQLESLCGFLEQKLVMGSQ